MKTTCNEHNGGEKVMAVQIDMEMPKCCGACKFVYDYCPLEYVCTLEFRPIGKEVIGRPHWCPLKEVKDDAGI